MYAITDAKDGTFMHLTKAETESEAIDDIRDVYGFGEVKGSEIKLTKLNADQYARFRAIDPGSDLEIEYIDAIESGDVDRVRVEEVESVDLGYDTGGPGQAAVRLTTLSDGRSHTILFQREHVGTPELGDEIDTDSAETYAALANSLGIEIGNHQSGEGKLFDRPELVEAKAEALWWLDFERHRRGES